MAEARVISIPTLLTDFYQVRVIEIQEMVSCERAELMDPGQTLGVDTAHLPSGFDSDDDEDPFSPTLLDWMRVRVQSIHVGQGEVLQRYTGPRKGQSLCEIIPVK